MKVFLYSMKCKSNIVDKSQYLTPLYGGDSIDGVGFNEYYIKSDTDLMHFNVVIKYSNSSSEAKWLYMANYVYIPKLKRYYYIENMTFERAGRLILKLSIDVLMTYRDAIKGSTQFIARQQFKYNGFYADSKYPLLQSKKVVSKKFRYTPFSRASMTDGNACIALTVTGGV